MPRILLIDGQEENRLAIASVVTNLKCTLVPLPTSQSAVQYLSENEVALIIFDLRARAQIANVTEAAKQIRHFLSHNPTPILCLTIRGPAMGHEKDEDVQRDNELIVGIGNADFISTPLNPKILESKISLFLELHEARQKLIEAETNTRASEEKFRSLSESIPQMVFVTDPNGRPTHLNHRWPEYTGIETADLIQQGWSQVIHPDDLQGFNESWKKARESGQTWVSEYRLQRHDGVYRWHLGHSEPECGESGRIQGWIGTTTDIENQKATEKALKESKETLESKVHERTAELSQAHAFLDSLIENIPNMIFVKDATDLKFVRFNRAGEELIGTPRENLIGKDDYAFFPPEEASAFQEKDCAVLSEGLIVDIPEEPISTLHKGLRTLHTKKIPLYDAHGTPRYLLGISEDITEKKKVEEERLQFIQAQIAKQETEKSAERLKLISEASALLGSSLDFETTLTNLTKTAVPAIADWCSVHLLQPDRNLKQLAVSNRDGEAAKPEIEGQQKYPLGVRDIFGPYKVLRTGQTDMIPDVDLDLLHRSGLDAEQFEALKAIGIRSYICAPIRARGQIIGTLSLVTTEESERTYTQADLHLAEDLGERAGFAVENSRLYREAQNLNRVKDEFLATLSHELRTPLNVIQGHAEILKTEAFTLSPSELISSADAIYRNAKAQTELIGDLLDVSSIITGKVSYKPAKIAPVATVNNIVQSLKPTADAKGVELFVDAPRSLDIALADPMRLHQIIWNLVSNAIKFTPHGGQVHINLKKGPHDWCIEVIDTGQGIDTEFLPYVFDRFRQEDASSTRKYGGLGLGLSIVRHLVELHGGSVRAESKGKGLGAKFTVTLPLSDVPPEIVSQEKKSAPHIAKPQAPVSVQLQNVNVLLVEDSPDNRILVQRMLTRVGATIVEAESAAQAREKLKNFEPDIIVSDIGMPEENGIEFIRKLRASGSERDRTIPAIALTAYVRQEEKEAAISAGFQAHVAKPVSAPALLGEIQNVLRKGGSLKA